MSINTVIEIFTLRSAIFLRQRFSLTMLIINVLGQPTGSIVHLNSVLRLSLRII